MIRAAAVSFYQLEDAAFQLRDYRDGVDSDPERLHLIDDRLDLIHSLKRKYGESIPDILTYLARNQSEADKIENRDEYVTRLQARTNSLIPRGTSAWRRIIEHLDALRLTVFRLQLRLNLDSCRWNEQHFSVELNQQADGDYLPVVCRWY